QARNSNGDGEPEAAAALAELAPGITIGAFARIYSDHRIARMYPPVFNAVVTGVPGPEEDRYLLGGRVDEVYLLGAIVHGVGLSLTCYSTNGQLFVALVTCPDLAPDVARLGDAFAGQVRILDEAATAAQAESD